MLRRLAIVEGWSFLALLGIAMPLKHFAGLPLAVTVFGWAHGVLFVLLCVVLHRTMRAQNWPLRRGARVFVAAVVPFGPFVLERHDPAWHRMTSE